jgi:hypothetical protein
LTLVPGGWPFLSLRGPVDYGLPLLIEGTPSGRFPVGTSDVPIPAGRLLRGGWRQSADPCFTHPQLAVSVLLLPTDDALQPRFNWRGLVIIVRSRVLRIKLESARCYFLPRFPSAYRNLRSDVNSGQVVGGRHREVDSLVGYEATWGARVLGRCPPVDYRRAQMCHRWNQGRDGGRRVFFHSLGACLLGRCADLLVG